MCGDSCSDIDKRNVPEVARPCSVDQNRDPFAGVVGADPSGVIAMIGRHAQKIASPQFGQKRTQSRIKPFKVARVS